MEGWLGQFETDGDKIATAALAVNSARTLACVAIRSCALAWSVAALAAQQYLNKQNLSASCGRKAAMLSLGWIHTIAAVTALVAGAVSFLIRKGTRRHRQIGWTYVISMLLLNVTALLIYRLFGRFGPFHVGAIFSLVTVLAGTAAAIGARRARGRRSAADRARALERHYQWMTWSYVGLAAAAVSEVATRTPALRPRPGQGLAFGITVAVATLVVVTVGLQLIRRRRSALLAPYQAAVERAPVVRTV